MVEDYPKEFAVAKWMKQELQKEYSISIPEVETYYLTLPLVSLKQDKVSGRVGVVIAAHGRSTATSMAEVVTTLLGVDNIRAVDMPLGDEATSGPRKNYSLCPRNRSRERGHFIGRYGLAGDFFGKNHRKNRD